MMNAKTLIKDALLAGGAHDPAAALSRVNDELCRNNPAEMFVTAWVGVLDLETGRVAFANDPGPDSALGAGSGLAGIAHRVGVAGGDLRTRREHDRFEVVVSVPAEAPAAAAGREQAGEGMPR